MDNKNYLKISKNANNVLYEIVKWWEIWMTSENPTKLGDPLIDDAKKILQNLGYSFDNTK